MSTTFWIIIAGAVATYFTRIGGHLILSTNYSKRDGVKFAARDFSSRTLCSENLSQSCGSSNTTPTLFSIPGGGLQQVTAAGGLTSNYGTYNYNPINYAQTPFERYGGMAMWNYDVSDKVELYGWASYQHTKTVQALAPTATAGYPFNVYSDNPYLNAAEQEAFFDKAANPQLQINSDGSSTISIRRRITEAGGRIETHTNETWQALAGLRGDFFDTGLKFDASVQYAQVHKHTLLENDLSYSALTNALKGNAKVRGDWGELMLDNVLRGSGLEEGVHYQRQKHAVDDEGARLRPDVVVRFPDERSVVIDSKVNLIAWQEAMNAATPEQSEDALRRHAVALRQHVKDLGEKNYPKALGSETLDITIAFVPIEGALSAALGADGGLQAYAFDNRVVFASPNTLMALLRVAERLWTRDKVQKQALKISEAGGLVLDALTGFLKDFNAMGSKLDDAAKAYADARNRLIDSPQSAISRARRLAELGSKAKRALPPELTPDPMQQLGASEDDEDGNAG